MQIYGLWEGYDADSSVLSRNVMPLSQLAGQEFALLYPIVGFGASGNPLYDSSRIMTIYRVLEVKDKPLPAGTYYMKYFIEDVFQRHLPVGEVEVIWDGTTLAFPQGIEWEGQMTLTIPE